MKKIIITIFIAIITFMITTSAYATSFYSNRLEGIKWHKYNGTIEEFKTANSFYEKDTNRLSYCIEPFTFLLEEATDYTEYTSYDSSFGYTKEQMDRINDLAYFGYGYGNHTEEKWISITQMLIWKTVDKTSIFEWIDGLKSRNHIDPYDAEIAELEALIENKNKKPSFVSGNSIEIGDHIELNDSNNVLSNYRIKETKGVNVNINGNKLTIDRIQGSDSGEITLIKDGSETSGSYFYSPTSQNLLIRGGSSSVEAKVNITVKKGSITVKKVDKDLNTYNSQGEANINGSVFELFDNEDNKIGEVTINNEGVGVFEDLYLGHYKLKEKTSGIGYRLDDNTYDIELTDEQTDFEITIKNKVIESILKIKKLYGSKNDLDNNSMNPESGISFEIYNNNNELVTTLTTDEFGTCEVLLPYGTYKIVQKNTTANYQMVEDRTITIDENSEEIIEIELYDVEIEVPNAYTFSLIEDIFKKCKVSLENL